MREEVVYFWFLPRPNGRKPYRSRWKMSEAEAARRGAVGRDEQSREVRQVPETDADWTAIRRATETGRVGNTDPHWWLKKE